MGNKRLGSAAFAAVMIALGLQGLHSGQFTAVWAPVPKGVPARTSLIYLCAVVSFAAGVGLLWAQSAVTASRVFFASLLLWWLVFRVSEVVRAPTMFPAWDGCAETTVMVAGAWVIYTWCAGPWDRRHLSFVTSRTGVHLARGLYGLALVVFGLAHFIYLKETAALVPPWLPAHVVVASVTGGAFIAAGVAVLIGVCARVAAALATLQIGLFTLVVWVPILMRGSKSPSDWSEFAISAALTAGAWVVADSYGDARRTLSAAGANARD